MIPESVNTPPGSRSSRLRLLIPVAILVGCLTVFLALFWHPGGHGRKGHGRGSAAERDRSPVGGSRDEGNSRVSSGEGGGSPVGGGPSRSGSRAKGETWWYKDGQRRGAGEDAWWAPGGRKSGSGEGSSRGGSPVGGGSDDEDRAKAQRDRADDEEERDARDERDAERARREGERPARASSSNPGEVAGQKGGPDDFWWRN